MDSVQIVMELKHQMSLITVLIIFFFYNIFKDFVEFLVKDIELLSEFALKFIRQSTNEKSHSKFLPFVVFNCSQILRKPSKSLFSPQPPKRNQKRQSQVSKVLLRS